MADQEASYHSSEDEDYVPNGEDLGHSSDNGEESKKDSKQPGVESTKYSKPKAKGKRHQEEEDDDDDDDDVEKSEEQIPEQDRQAKERVDNLWASFKQDVAPKTLVKEPSSTAVSTSDVSKQTVTITRSYDFAGEEVNVTKEVSTDSKEGKLFLASLEKTKEKKEEDEGEQHAKEDEPPPKLNPVRTKRASGLSSVLSQLTKKPKMSTLDKSKLDWDSFKEKKGIQAELARGAKDGYLEKKAFLERVDWQTYQVERDQRMKASKSHK